MRTLVPLLLAVSFARAEIVTSKIEYRDGDAVLEGILVHDDEAQLAELHVLAQQRVRADDDIGLSLLHFALDRRRVLRADEP